MSLKHQFLMVDDDILQNLLFDSNGNTFEDIDFNEWGITLIEHSEQEKWIKLISNRNSEKNYKIENLKILFIESYKTNKIIIHLGI